jgi:N-dimethylarginine dimethylaminohydrolase
MRYLVSRTRCEDRCSESDDACAYRVAWAINPHMRVGAACPDRATRQHSDLVATLRSLGAHVDELPFVHGAFDSVFAKDSAVVVEREGGGIDAVVARPRFEQRQAEQEARTRALHAHGVRVVGAARTALEGGDVVMLPGARAAFLGHGFRSAPAAAEDLADRLGVDVTCIALRDPRLYHLDMALAVLDDGTALVCAEALANGGLAAIEAHPSVTDVVLVPLAEALSFGTNIVQVGSSIVTAADAPATRRALAARGYRVRRVALDDFHLAGGSAACLSARVHRQVEAVGEDVAPESRAA